MVALNLYASLSDFQARFINAVTPDSSDVTQVELCLEAASREVDEYCNRTFYPVTESRIFDGSGRNPNNIDYINWASRVLYTGSMSFLRIPDLISATAVAIDPNSTGTFPTTLTTPADYYLLNEGANNQDAPPFNRFQLNIYGSPQISVLASLPRYLKITGTWGYGNATVTDPGTATLADATTTTMTASGATSLSRGQTLLLGSEQVYVASGAGNNWTVQRAVNGTTGAAHAAVAINRYVYVPQVREAALLMAARMWERRKTAFTSVTVNPGGAVEFYKGLDVDIPVLLDTIRRRFV